MVLTLVLLTAVVCSIVAYFWNVKCRYDYFIRRHVPGPPPRFLFGHYFTFWSTDRYSRELQDWTKQYGSIYGVFEGSRAIYVVSDADFLQEVYIKQFASFHTRRLPFIMKESSMQSAHLLAAKGATWRRQRQVINPTFSTAKLKLMSPLISRYIDSLMSKLNHFAEQNEEFNVYELYKRLTMDVICRCAFGLETDMQNDVNNMFLRKAQATIDNNPDHLFPVKVGNIFPFLIPLMKAFLISRVLLVYLFRKVAPDWFLPQIEEFGPIWILHRGEQVIKARTENNNPTHSVDLLQLMLDASTKDPIKEDKTDESIESKKLHQKEVGLNVFLFLIAGYETTSTALASATYILATHLDIQEKLRNEVDEQEWQDDNQVNYDLVMNMNYMDLFIREVLRMYPITTTAIARECNQTTDVCGLRIEEGCIIQPDVFTVHHDWNLWGPEDPNLFYPERHATKRHPAAFLPFGIGPRNCVGMRFALMELKMCLAQVLRQHIISSTNQTEKDFEKNETLVIRPNGLRIKLEKR